MSWAPYDASVGRVLHLRVEQARLRELRAVHGRRGRAPRSRCASPTPTASTACRSRRPTARQLAWTSSRSGGAAGQLFLAQWNHEKALEAIKNAPPRKPSEEIMSTNTTNRRARGARRSFVSAISALCGGRCRGVAAPRSRRRRARTSRRSRRRGSKGGSPDRTASGSPATTSSPSCRRSARSRCPGRRTSGCRSSSPPARATADRRSASTVDAPATPRHVRPRARDVQALSFSDNGDVDGAGRLRRLRHRRAREPGLRLRQLRDARREGQDRPRAALLPRGRRTRRRKAILARYADLRYKAMAARQRGAKAMLVVTGPRSPNAGETDADDASTRRSPARASSPRASAATSPTRCSRRAGKTLEAAQKALDAAQPARRRLRAAGRHASRSTPAVVREKQTGHNVVALSAGDDAGRPASPSRGSRSARTTITSATARTATRSPARTTPARFIRRRRQRVGHRGRARRRRRRSRSSRAAGTCSLGFWSGEELGLIGSTAFVDARRRCRSISSPPI